MFTIRSARWTRAAIATIALGAAIAVPSTAFADTGGGGGALPPASSRDATITITSTEVTARLIVTVGIDYVCQPFQSYDWDTGQTFETTAGSIEGGDVVVLQAQGRTVAAGTGFASGTVICDGSTVNHLSVPVAATTSPWRNGSAIVDATVLVSDIASFNDSDYASSGPITVRLGSR
jgi:hypothetical protein